MALLGEVSALPATEDARVPGRSRRVRRILLATDLSTASEGATEEALALARDLRADLLVVSVIDPASHLPGLMAARMDQRRAAREVAAQGIVVRGRRAGVNVNFLVWEGEPGPAIVEAAASEGVDLVVVGTRSRSRVERLVLGSVSDHVVRHAPCPILIVRPDPGPV
jgi:nucleotide-binding universal stress UspA family protein